MPLYEFQCPRGHLIEKRFGMNEVPDYITCEECWKQIQYSPDYIPSAFRILSPTSLKFKGSGFYVNDYPKSK